MSAIRSHTLNQAERRVLSMPGCIGLASDLVETDAAYRPILENLLGRTVIADSLDHGIAIQRAGGHSFRLVTLQGDVMHSGGSMTGGSVQSRATGLLSREREVKELAEALKTGKVRFDRMKEELKEKQEELLSLRRASAEALNDLHQQEIAVTRESEHTSAAQTALEEHRDRMEQTAAAIEQLRDAMEGIDRELAGLEERHDTEQSDRTALEDRTQSLQDTLFAAREETRLRSEAVVTRTLQLSDANHTLDVMTRDADRRTEDRRSLEEDIRLREEQLSAMAEADSSDAVLERDAAAGAEELRQDLARRDQAVTALENERNALQAGLRTLLQEIEQLHEVLTRDGDRRHRSELAKSRAETDLRTLQDRIWNTW